MLHLCCGSNFLQFNCFSNLLVFQPRKKLNQTIHINHCIWIKNKNRNTVLYSNKEPNWGLHFMIWQGRCSIQIPTEVMINRNDNPAFTDLRVCPSLAQGMSPSCCNLSHVTCTPTKNNYIIQISVGYQVFIRSQLLKMWTILLTG